MGYLLGYTYDGAYRIWIPRIGMRESRDVVFYEGMASALPDDRAADEGGSKLRFDLSQPLRRHLSLRSLLHSPRRQHRGLMSRPGSRTMKRRRRVTIRVPGRHHSRAPQPRLQNQHATPRMTTRDQCPLHYGETRATKLLNTSTVRISPQRDQLAQA